jgi:hypothetical protein
VSWRLRAIAATTVIPPLLAVMSFERLERLLATTRTTAWRGVPRDEDAAWWVDRALGRLPAPWKLTCLRRAAVLYYLLRRAGRMVELCIGVRRDEKGELLAHAWLVLDGRMYLEPSQPDGGRSYTVIARFPSGSSDEVVA